VATGARANRQFLARALMASHNDGLIDYLDADLHDTQPILDQAARILDFSQPVAIMLIAIMHAIGDHDDPYGIVATLLGAVPPGSYLVLSHGASDIDAKEMAEVARRINRSSHQQFTPKPGRPAISSQADRWPAFMSAPRHRRVRAGLETFAVRGTALPRTGTASNGINGALMLLPRH
jgi:hypothetical protein